MHVPTGEHTPVDAAQEPGPGATPPTSGFCFRPDSRAFHVPLTGHEVFYGKLFLFFKIYLCMLR